MNLCFAYLNGKCVCLTDDVCVRPCGFFKTREELAAQKERAVRRLKSLPEDRQQYIREKYYNGGSFK